MIVFDFLRFFLQKYAWNCSIISSVGTLRLQKNFDILALGPRAKEQIGQKEKRFLVF